MSDLNALPVRAGGANDFKEQIFRCNLNVTDLCNQHCSYCINKDSFNKNVRSLPLKILEEFIEDIRDRVKNKVYFSVAGGEPFIYPHLNKLFELINTKIKAEYIQLRFLTNGSLLPEAALPLYDIKKDIDIQYVVSIHMGFMKFDKFLQRISDFPYKNDILCKILMAPQQMDKARQHLQKLQDAGLTTYVSAVSGVPQPYTQEEKEFLRANTNVSKPIDLLNCYEDGRTIFKHDNDMHFKKGFFNYKNMLCSAGINSLRLAPDGKVVPCFGIFAMPKDKRMIFDLTKKRLRDIPELKKPFICPSTYCFCAPFLSAPKWRPSVAGPEWLHDEE